MPFRIPTTCGQQRALPWIPNDSLEAPHTTGAVLKRMFLEVFLFRSLFRNTRMKLQDGNVVYGSTKWLWLGALAFHYAFFTILIRHLRFFLEPVPARDRRHGQGRQLLPDRPARRCTRPTR